MFGAKNRGFGFMAVSILEYMLKLQALVLIMKFPALCTCAMCSNSTLYLYSKFSSMIELIMYVCNHFPRRGGINCVIGFSHVHCELVFCELVHV